MQLCIQVPDGATVALVPRNTKHHLHDSHDYMPGESESRAFLWLVLSEDLIIQTKTNFTFLWASSHYICNLQALKKNHATFA